METDIVSNIMGIRQRMTAAAERSGRNPENVHLMAVSKTVPPERVQQAIKAGITWFGENYVQEAREKIPAVGQNVSWHMIGHLQTNKVKYVVHLFDWIHSVDRIELARELDKRAGTEQAHAEGPDRSQRQRRRIQKRRGARAGSGTGPANLRHAQPRHPGLNDDAPLFG